MNRNDFIVAPEEVFSMYVAKPQTDVPETELVKGSLSHLVNTEKLTLSFLKMEKFSEFEVHTHPQTQIMIVVSGSCDEIIDGKLFHVTSGDVIYLPSEIPHGAFLNEEDCYAIDMFVGGRPDYLEKFYKQNPGCSLPFDGVSFW